MPPKFGADVELGGEVRTLRYTSSSLRKLQKKRGGEPLTSTVIDVGRISLDAIAAMVWAGLLHENPKITVDEAADMIHPPLRTTVEGIMDALDPWLDDGEGDESEESEPVSKKKDA